MNNGELIPPLFRTEYRKIVSVLCRRFGFDHVETAEDIASDTFLTAAQSWGPEGLPENPVAWLYYVAANKAKNHLQRQALFEKKISSDLKKTVPVFTEADINLSPQNIDDSQLQMMFALCHPSISQEAQIGLSLRILCGFGIGEIADAFLSNKETINKRLLRAKEKLREEKIKIESPPAAMIDERISSVLACIYLLFNEGYYSISNNKTLSRELCLEAMRLCTMLIENSITNKPQANALLSLMCFHASRFDARVNHDGGMVLYEEQDTSLWNKDLISKGVYFLQNAALGNMLSKYHLEAGIAYWHTVKEDSQEKWTSILQLYDQLSQIDPSPMVALNRVYAIWKAKGSEEALLESKKLNLPDHHFYHALLGELYTGIDNRNAKLNFQQAYLLAKTDNDKQAIRKKIEKLINA